MRASFAALIVGVWACGRVWALTSLGAYFITGPEYKDRKPNSRQKWTISKVQLSSGDAASPLAVLECSRRCTATPGCSSFSLRPSTRTCFLYGLDHCADMSFNLHFSRGEIFYDLVPGADGGRPETCFRKCLTKYEGKCSSCGFPSCGGHLCTRCPSRCWELSWPVTGGIKLWKGEAIPYRTQCEGKWQLIWPGVKASLTEEGIELKVKVIYEDGAVLTYFYSDAMLKSHRLTVGSPANSSTNWWKAPFAHRRISEKDDASNCFRFFYPPGECQANGVPSGEEQILAKCSVYQRGFAWKTGETLRDATRILKIQLWATRL